MIAAIAGILLPAVGMINLIYHDRVDSVHESNLTVVEDISGSEYDTGTSSDHFNSTFESKNIGGAGYDNQKEALPESVYLAGEAEKILNNMTLYEKVCQMFIVTPEQLTGVGQVTASGPATRNSLGRIPVGGIIYLQPNLQNPKQTRTMLSNIQEYAEEIEGIPLFLCVDEEGGRVSRIGGNASFGIERTLPMANISSVEEAHDAGAFIGSYLADLGFNVDFAPVCDVLTNPANQVIGNRSFGSDAETVNSYAREFSNGLHEYGILSTYKHFPGHGATAEDTHKGFAYTDKSLEELLKAELVPFADAENSGADMVMVSHISVPKILGEDIPCSLSYYMVTEVLKESLGYNGLVITDAMNMGAITDAYNKNEAVIMAVKAGNDMILTPMDLESAVNAVVEEVNTNEIDEDRIDDSVRRIILRKLYCN